jgi:hypothetical protein
MASIESMGKHLKITCLGREILVFIIFECRKWRVENAPLSNLKEVVDHDCCPIP